MSSYPMNPACDEDRMFAAVDVVRRSGATDLEFGYLHEGVPIREADWWAHARYRGARIMVEHHRDPLAALEALARRVLTGARCVHCGGLVALSDDGAIAFPGQMADGSTWTLDEIKAADLCRYTRVGRRWVRGCEQHRERPSARGPKVKSQRRKKRRR